MNRCPITYEPCEGDYSVEGLRRLSPKLTALSPLPFTAEELRLEAALRAIKMSVQGVQPKLSARLEPTNGRFHIVDSHGTFIIKPQSSFPELPENEDLTMRLAAMSGINVPLHGLVYAKDHSLNYFIRRFDRIGRNTKLPLEDFAQLANRTRDTKYDFSMEGLVQIIDRHCTFPVIQKQDLFIRVIFNYLVGNEDMHLKNYSLIRREDMVELAPAYDFLNSTIVLRDPVEIALPLNGKQKKLTRNLLVDYWGMEKLELRKKVIDDVLDNFKSLLPSWKDLLDKSFLSEKMKEDYWQVVLKRSKILASRQW